nr:ribonuclease H-like domain-containing protein [Tanacetum cinerariifolium]
MLLRFLSELICLIVIPVGLLLILSKTRDDGDPVSDSTLYWSLVGSLTHIFLKQYNKFVFICMIPESPISRLLKGSSEVEDRGVPNAVAETFYLSSNPVQHQRTKHIEIDIHFVQDLVTAGQVRVLHVSSLYQYTDIFTKGSLNMAIHLLNCLLSIAINNEVPYTCLFGTNLDYSLLRTFSTFSRYKARLMTNGSTQLEGIDVDETFIPVFKSSTIQTVLSLATSRHWSIHQLDVKNSFLHGDLSETVYMHQSLGIQDPHVISSLRQEFFMTYLGSLNYFLGKSVTRDSTGMFLSQRKYAVEIIEILRYVRGLLDHGLKLFSSSTTFLVAYSDADWAGSPTTRSVEAEYCGVANAIDETCCLWNLLRELHTPLSFATLVYYDNVSAVYLYSNLVQHQRTKHVKINIHFVRDLVAADQETAPQVVPPKAGQPSNAQAVQAVEAWRHLEFLCHNYILNGLVDSLCNVYYKTMTAKELWESLERKYKTEDAGIKKFAVARFLNYKMVDSKNVITQMLQGTCYNCDQPGHRAANCKMPKRVTLRYVNMVNDDMDMIAMAAVDNGEKLYNVNTATANIKGEGDNLVSSWLLNKFGFCLVFESDKFVLSKNQMYVGMGYAVNGKSRLYEVIGDVNMCLHSLIYVRNMESDTSSLLPIHLSKTRQQDDNDLKDKSQDQPKEEEVEPRRSKRARTEKSFGLDFVSFMVENEPTSYQEAIFKKKMKADGTIDKYKARLVIKGFRQSDGLDYFDTYSAVTRITSIRMVLAIAALRNLDVQ